MVGSLFVIGKNSRKRKLKNLKKSDLGGFQLLETRGGGSQDSFIWF